MSPVVLTGWRIFLSSFFLFGPKWLKYWESKRNLILSYLCQSLLFCEELCVKGMASPGQKRGLCIHIMVKFDGNEKCAQCREKGVR